MVFEPVRLVHHEVGPLDLAQLGCILEHQLVGGDEHVKLEGPPRGVVVVELEGSRHLPQCTRQESLPSIRGSQL